MTKNRIVVVGSSNTDLIIKVERIPRPGETVIGGEFATAAGGKGANQAVAAARAGGAVTFVACVGQDAMGQTAVAGFVEAGISVDYVIRDAESPSGVALIFVGKDGENSIAVASGANARLTPASVENARGVFSESSILLTQLESPIETVERAIGLAADAGMKVILNPAPARHLPRGLLQKVWLLTPNQTEAETCSGVKVTDGASAVAAATELRKLGVENVIVTLGENGAIVVHEDRVEKVPGFKVPVIDTTGAGDVFNGAIAVALSEGLPLPAAASFANAAAALSVTRFGAQPSAPMRDEIERMLASGAQQL